jgi:hypothetical protein
MIGMIVIRAMPHRKTPNKKSLKTIELFLPTQPPTILK